VEEVVADGLVNILGIILGVIVGGGTKTVLAAAGFAAASKAIFWLVASYDDPGRPSCDEFIPGRPG
jgi:hypothetical protein